MFTRGSAWTVLSAIVVCLMLLSACVVPVATPETIVQTVEVEVPVVETRIVEVEPERPFEGQTLSIAMSTGATDDDIVSLIPIFEKETGINVELDQIPQASYGEKVALDLSAGTGQYDMVHIEFGQALTWPAAGFLHPLDEFIESDPDFNVDDFFAGTMGFFSSEGHQWGIPFVNETLLCYYNKELFEQAGLPDRCPKDFAEVEEFAKTIKEETGVPGITARGTGESRQLAYTSMIFLYANGYQWFDEDYNATMNTPETIETAGWYAQLLNNYGPTGIAAFFWEDAKQSFQTGQAGMFFDASVFAGDFEDPEQSAVAGKVGYGVVPEGTVAATPGVSGIALGIPAAAKNKDLAWEFIEWATSYETQLATAQVGKRGVATREAVWAHPRFLEINNYGGGAWAQAFADSVAIAYSPWYPRASNAAEMVQTLSVAMNEVLVGAKSGEEAFNDANANLEKLISEAGLK